MKKLILPLIVLIILGSACDSTVDPPPPPPPTKCESLICDSPIFEDYNKSANVVYGIDANSHKMSVYVPFDDEREKRPLIILLAGGSFSSSNYAGLEPLALELVKYGFVVATAGYRVGDNSPGIPYITRLIEAIQDAKAATRFFRKEATTYRIDEEHIILGGFSAGAITALNCAYVDFDEVNPQVVDLLIDLGGLEGEQGNAGYSSSVHAVISLAGALVDAPEVVQEGEEPLFAVHGTNDNEIRNEIFEGSGGSFWYASSPLVDYLQSIEIPAEVYLIENGGHSSPLGPSGYSVKLVDFLRSLD